MNLEPVEEAALKDAPQQLLADIVNVELETKATSDERYLKCLLKVGSSLALVPHKCRPYLSFGFIDGSDGTTVVKQITLASSLCERFWKQTEESATVRMGKQLEAALPGTLPCDIHRIDRKEDRPIAG